MLLHLLFSPAKRAIGYFQRLRRRDRLNLIIILGGSLMGLNLLYAVNPGHAFTSTAATMAVGGAIGLVSLLFLFVLVAEHRRRFAPRPKALVDVICLDCDLVGGRTALCPGCPYNPLDPKAQRQFDLLETI